MGNKHGKRKATSDSTSSPAAANKSSSPVKQQQQHASSSSNWLTLKNSIRTDVRGAKKQHSRVVSSPLSISASPGTSSAALNDAGAAAAQSEAAEGAPSERQRKKKRRHSAMTMTAAAAAADEDEDEDEGPFAAGGQASSSQARKGSAAAAVSEPKPAATAAAANKSKTAAAAGGRGTSDEHAPASSAVGNKHDVPIESIMAGIAHSASERKPGHYIALDCEMVGVGPGASESALARVSVVNFHGVTLLDTLVRPREKVTDYRTWVSGIQPGSLDHAPTFDQVQKDVAQLIEGRVLVGHAISNDTKALLLSHPHTHIRDTSKYQPLQALARTKRPSLRTLARLICGLSDLHSKEHDSVMDARATMCVYRSQKPAWESALFTKRPPRLCTTTTPFLEQAARDVGLVTDVIIGRSSNHKDSTQQQDDDGPLLMVDTAPASKKAKRNRPSSSYGLATTLRALQADGNNEEDDGDGDAPADEDDAGVQRDEVRENGARSVASKAEKDDDLVLGLDTSAAPPKKRARHDGGDAGAKAAAAAVSPAGSSRKNAARSGGSRTKAGGQRGAGAAAAGEPAAARRPPSKANWWQDGF